MLMGAIGPRAAIASTFRKRNRLQRFSNFVYSLAGFVEVQQARANCEQRFAKRVGAASSVAGTGCPSRTDYAAHEATIAT